MSLMLEIGRSDTRYIIRIEMTQTWHALHLWLIEFRLHFWASWEIHWWCGRFVGREGARVGFPDGGGEEDVVELTARRPGASPCIIGYSSSEAVHGAGMRGTSPSPIASAVAKASAAVASTGIVVAAITLAAPTSAPADEAIRFSWRWRPVVELRSLTISFL